MSERQPDHPFGAVWRDFMYWASKHDIDLSSKEHWGKWWECYCDAWKNAQYFDPFWDND